MNGRSVWRLAIAAVLLSGPAAGVLAVEHGVLDVVENDTGNDLTSVTVTRRSGTAGFDVFPGSNRGDYNFAIQNSVDTTFDPLNDQSFGIALTTVYQNSSTSSAVDPVSGLPDVRVSTTAIARNADGSYFVPVHSAPAGSEWNVDVGIVYFPFENGWYAGHAFNSTNANPGVIDVLNGPLGIGNEAPPIRIDGVDPINPGDGIFTVVSGGQSTLTVPGVDDTRRQGIMFVTHGKNEDNYALSGPSADGSVYELFVKDNGTNGASTEEDPIAFAFVPLGTPNVVMGRISGQGVTMIGSGDFTIDYGVNDTSTGNEGTYFLEIPGQDPTTGTIMVSPARSNGGSGFDGDNIVAIQPSLDGTGWVVEVRDLPGPGLQSNDAEAAFHFAFFPNDGSVTSPGPIIPVSDLGFDATLSSVVAGNVEVTEINPGNGNFDLTAQYSNGSFGTFVPSVNRGDIAVGHAGDFLIEGEGVLFATLTQNFRDNSATGGFADFGVNPSTNVANGRWFVRTSTANGNAGFNDEHNINFATAHFQTNSGFDTGVDLPTVAGEVNVLPGSDVPSVTDATNLASQGVLIVGGNGNDDNYASVTVGSDGFGDVWQVELRDNQGTLEGGTDGINHVYIPFADNVAGRIAADGSILASSEISPGVANFSLTRTAPGTYELTIDGVTPDDGMLLLNSALGGSTTSLPGSGSADFNGDGAVDAADYTVWRDNLGSNEATIDIDGSGEVDAGDYTLWREQFGTPGSTAGGGFLVDGGAIMSYEAGLNGEFIIQTLMVEYETDDLGGFVVGSSTYTVADYEFQFAYIGFDNAPVIGSLETAAVPEPATIGTCLLATLGLLAARRRLSGRKG